MTINRVFRSSRANRDRRDQAFARSVIAEATNCFNHTLMIRAVDDAKVEIEVCPDCLGTGEIVRQIADGVEREAVCLECNGSGWIK